jgi:SnoaL-like polyketide cyclase
MRTAPLIWLRVPQWYGNSIQNHDEHCQVQTCDPTFAAEPCRKIGAMAVIKTNLCDVYRNYIACLNKQEWPTLGQFVHDEVIHNARRVGLSGYMEMLARDFDEIPDLYFNVELLICDPPFVASRIGFD